MELGSAVLALAVTVVGFALATQIGIHLIGVKLDRTNQLLEDIRDQARANDLGTDEDLFPVEPEGI